MSQGPCGDLQEALLAEAESKTSSLNARHVIDPRPGRPYSGCLRDARALRGRRRNARTTLPHNGRKAQPAA